VDRPEPLAPVEISVDTADWTSEAQWVVPARASPLSPVGLHSIVELSWDLARWCLLGFTVQCRTGDCPSGAVYRFHTGL